MIKVELLEQLKAVTEDAVKDLLLPVEPPEDSEETVENPSLSEYSRPADVYIPRLPEMSSYAKKAPFITHEIITSQDRLVAEPSGDGPAARYARRVHSTAVVRTCFCVYHPDEQEGALALLGLMERVRIALLEQVVIGKQFKLELDGDGVQTLVYPLNPGQVASAPFYLGEMLTVWRIPAIERKVPNYVYEKGHSNLRGKPVGKPDGCGGYHYGGQD